MSSLETSQSIAINNKINRLLYIIFHYTQLFINYESIKKYQVLNNGC